MHSLPTELRPGATAPERPTTPYGKLGGEAGLRQLTLRFYELMDELPEAWSIRHMYPDDLEGSRQKLFEFLSGWLGGPNLFHEHRGHAPRLRSSHSAYPIGPNARDEWMLCMRWVLAEQVPDEGFRQALLIAFEQMADHLINHAECPAHAREVNRPDLTEPAHTP